MTKDNRSCKLLVYRLEDPFLLRNIGIKINDQKYKIGFLGVLTIDLPPGTYQIQANLDFVYTSNKITIELNEHKSEASLYLSYKPQVTRFIDLFSMAFKFKSCFNLSEDVQAEVTVTEEKSISFNKIALLVPSFIALIPLIIGQVMPSLFKIPVEEIILSVFIAVIFYIRYISYLKNKLWLGIKYYSLFAALVFLFHMIFYVDVRILNLNLCIIYFLIYFIDTYFLRLPGKI